MSKPLHYEFGQYGENEFEFDSYDIQDFIAEKLSKEELKDLAIYILDEILDNKSRLEWIENYEHIPNLYEGNVEDDSYYEFVKDIVSEYADDDEVFDYLEDELKLYYESEAYEEYLDNEAYRKDPLGYYGMKQSDFI